MEAYFILEDFAKSMLFNSKTKKDEQLWQHVLELNKSNAEHLYIN